MLAKSIKTPVYSREPSIADCAHVAHKVESLCDSKLVELFSLVHVSITVVLIHLVCLIIVKYNYYLPTSLLTSSRINRVCDYVN